MAKFIIFYNGPVPGADASHAGWFKWFGGLGKKLVEQGSPIRQSSGFAVLPDGSVGKSASTINGYGIIQARDEDEAADLVKDHPILQQEGYSVEVFRLS